MREQEDVDSENIPTRIDQFLLIFQKNLNELVSLPKTEGPQ